MKKLAIIATAVLCVGGFAFAATFPVPWFLDNGGLASGTGTPSSGTAAWMRIMNATSSPIVCTIQYKTAAGAAAGSPATFTVDAGAVRAWRPYADDPVEGAGRTMPNSTSSAGCATITFTGNAGDCAGSVTTIVSDGNMSAYTLMSN